MMIKRSPKFLLLLSGLLPLSACDESVKYEDRTLNISLNACLGDREASEEGLASTCRTRLDQRVAASESNACLLIRRTEEGSEVHPLPLRWQEGRMSFLEQGELPLAVGQEIEAELYLFSAEEEAGSCTRGLAFGSACETTTGCLLKLIQTPSSIGEKGLEFDFGGDSGACRTEGPLDSEEEAEICDGADNDCDGEIDEGEPGAGEACDSGALGICQPGIQTCVEGTIRCDSLSGPEQEICGDGLDNDCDGELDEEIGWRPNPEAETIFIGQPCEQGQGLCRASGTVVCNPENPREGLCDAQPGEADVEICDALDNDCDGETDEGFELGMPCTVGQGECRREGLSICENGGMGCNAQSGEMSPEICDGKDNDCDGLEDEDFPELSQSCSLGVGACLREGTFACRADNLGSECNARTGSPAQEICGDELDNDCDGETDEDFRELGQACEVGIGECKRHGVRICDPNLLTRMRCSVDAAEPGVDDNCDGLDDDCDEELDEHYESSTVECGEGACGAVGQLICRGGEEQSTCRSGEPAEDDANCDDIDDDCDGELNEDWIILPTACGVGACAAAGRLVCVRGETRDTCQEGEPAVDDSNCDGRDDDCNGEVDEEFQGQATECGVGACWATGHTRCEEAQILDSCQPEEPAVDDATCDLIDDDCDGDMNEDWEILPTQCGIQACASTGSLICVQGEVQDTCHPREPAADDANCDGVDDDCDEIFDEDFLSQATSCGVGACAATGRTECCHTEECGGAQIIDTCTAEEPISADDATCDAIDDNCNGNFDEDFSSQETECGRGECHAQGLTFCVQGVVQDSCVPEHPAADDASCDGRDDDCDGEFDEDFLSQETRCGVGACAATGQTECIDAQIIDSCVPGEPALDDVTCDAIDDNCNGSFDEGFSSQETECGRGECHALGRTFCVQGEVQDSCAPRLPAEGDASCDGRDDDCDGSFDEDFLGNATECGVGACAAGGQILCVEGRLQDSCTPRPPAADDVSCDGVDDDCDALIDEDFQRVVVQCGEGSCGDSGETICINGQEEDTCAPGTPALNDASCDGVDDDCDGVTDEDYLPQETQCGVGACASTGLLSCVNGAEQDSCIAGDPAPDDASCDGVDDDCDGRFDENYRSLETQCGQGECLSQGRTFCIQGVVEDSCEEGQVAPNDPTCDGRDDDCDGRFDEDYIRQEPQCGIGACVSTGRTRCQGGRILDSCRPLHPADDDATCDNIDDDCDGIRDENFLFQETECGRGECLAQGRTFCVQGVLTDSCVPGEPAGDDPSCDGRDDDCDGEDDEDYLSQGTECGVGDCFAEGVTLCVAGEIQDSCTPGDPANDDATCDGIDDDCDALTDEDFVREPVVCGEGSCGDSGETICINGGEENTCAPGEAAGDDATCDGVDDDCDGVTDEDYTPQRTQCGVGICVSTGWLSCVGGVEQDSCVTGDPAINDANCNTVDDDCNGEVDEDYPVEATSCGVGPCAAVGLLTCDNGAITDSCTPGVPANSDASCNGNDDNCNGAVDEEYLGEETVCGIGECIRTGRIFCVNGSEQDSCVEGIPGNDNNCDGRDNDCDGEIDEHYLVQQTECGIGPCISQGHTRCVNGTVEDDCIPGVPPGEDTNCDNIDNDCDGTVDDDYVRVVIECGEGSCGEAGEIICVNGQEYNTCQPGEPAADDSTCDGIDDDCDGETDEDYVRQNTSCGIGLCVSQGTLKCVNGAEHDSCVPGNGAVDDSTCDDIDDDCDGQSDEEYSPPVTNCGVGACAAQGLLNCQNGVEVDTCSPGVAGDELCGNLSDDDCDGEVDEGFPNLEQDCIVGQGECEEAGILVCTADGLNTTCSVSPTEPQNEICDGLDNDCDGDVDEENPGGGAPCSMGEQGVCDTGLIECIGGAPACVQIQGAEAEICDGLDNDCDGDTDEELGQSTCGLGICENTVDNCLLGEEQLCEPLDLAVAEICDDGLDNNCDGDVDAADAGCP